MNEVDFTRSMRLDQYVIQELPRLSRGYAVRLINEEKVLVNGKPVKPGYKLRESDRVTIDFDEASLDSIPEIDLPILYEDENVVVINKPAGVISHARGKYWDEPSVASFIRQKVANLEGERAGIVHRLDRATSGVMICAKNPETLKFLQKQFGDRNVIKTYTAIIVGHISPDEAVIDMPIERNPKAPSTFRVGPNGKSAITTYKLFQRGNDYDELELTPKTGRTHQLRVHLKQRGHVIVGDMLYGAPEAGRLFLHAHRLEITLPGGNRTIFEAPIPKEFADLMNTDA